MIFGKIWQRTFLKQLMKILLWLLFIFFAIYILIDYAHRVHYFSHYHGMDYALTVAKYYLSDFARRLDILLPFAITLSTIATLTASAQHGELVALLTSGVRMRLLLTPFILVGLVSTLFIYANEQLILPTALRKIRAVEESRIRKKQHRNHQSFVQHVVLKDGSRLLFTHFNHQTQEFEDLVWIRSFNRLFRMKYLSIKTPTTSIGYWVEEIGQSTTGEWHLLQQFETRPFPEIAFNKKLLLERLIPIEEMSLSSLWRKLPSPRSDIWSERESEIATLFHQKMALPWLCLLAALAPAPFCIRFSRHIRLFLIYGCALFGLLAFYLLLNAMAVLGMRQIISPVWAIWFPFLSLIGLISPSILRLK